jgi:2'-5' RNA ligase
MTTNLITQQQQVICNTMARRQLDGREYAVAPATIIVAGVLKGELVPADELADFAERWNGRPLPLRHPKDELGNYIVANDPSVVESSVLGQFFNAEFTGDRIRGEMWLDVAKAQRLGGDALKVLDQLDSGEVIEVSTGYWALQVDDAQGTFNGQPYSGIQRNLVPDHIALLPDEVGACSVAQGCGAGRWNALAAQHDGVMLAFYLRPDDAQAMALTAGPDGVEVLGANELHVTLAYLGKVDEMQIEESWLLEMASFIARDTVVQIAEVNGQGRFLNAEQNDGMEPLFAICQAEGLYHFRKRLVEWLEQMDSEPDRYHGYLPHITLAYAPPGVEVPLQLARRALVFDALAVSWGDRTVTFPLQGEIREEMIMNEQEKKQAKVKAKAKPVANEELAAVADGATGVETVEITAEIEVTDEQAAADAASLAGLLSELGGVDALRDALTAIKANAQGQKAGAIARLVANRACAFSQADLEAMPLEHVIKLDRSLTPALYEGAAGMAFNTTGNNEWRSYETPKLN